MALVYMSGSCMCSRSQKTHLPKPLTFSNNLPSLLPLFPSSSSSSLGTGGRTSTHVVRARKGLSSRTRRLENKGKKGALTTDPEQEEEVPGGENGIGETMASSFPLEGVEGGGGAEGNSSASPLPELPGLQPNFWEGPQWDGFGFVVQYLWAFGVVFSLIACGVAVATYNDGATDFKDTPVYKESIQSRELLDEPDTSSSDVFEGNPTEAAPSLE